MIRIYILYLSIVLIPILLDVICSVLLAAFRYLIKLAPIRIGDLRLTPPYSKSEDLSENASTSRKTGVILENTFRRYLLPGWMTKDTDEDADTGDDEESSDTENDGSSDRSPDLWRVFKRKSILLDGSNFMLASLGLFVYATAPFFNSEYLNVIPLEYPTLAVGLLGFSLFICSAVDVNYDAGEEPDDPEYPFLRENGHYLKEYELLNDERIERDKNVIWGVYFFLAISAFLIRAILYDTGFSSGMEGDIKTLVAVVGSVVSLLFLVTITSQQYTRGQLQERQKRIEEIDGLDQFNVATLQTIQAPRPTSSNFSVSSLSWLALFLGVAFWVIAYSHLMIHG